MPKGNRSGVNFLTKISHDPGSFASLSPPFDSFIHSKNIVAKSVAFVLLFLGQALSGLITVLEDKEYMVTVREKMNNIKKVAKFYNYDFLNVGK